VRPKGENQEWFSSIPLPLADFGRPFILPEVKG